jgi:hypothetical protein
MISTNGVKSQTSSSLGKYLNIGRYNVKINEISLRKSAAGTSTQVSFKLETPPITTPGWEPAEGATGQVGTVNTIYMKTDEQVNEFIGQLALLADKLGVREQVDAIAAETIEVYMEKITPLITGKFFWGRIVGEQYLKNDGSGKTGTRLHWSRYKAFASNAEVEEKGLDKCLKDLDPTNKNDLRPVKVDNTTTEPQANGNVF